MRTRARLLLLMVLTSCGGRVGVVDTTPDARPPEGGDAGVQSTRWLWNARAKFFAMTSAVVVDGTGRVFAAGTTMDGAWFGTKHLWVPFQDERGFLAGFDEHGNTLFAELLDEGYCSSPYSLLLAPDGDLVVTGLSGDEPEDGVSCPTGGGYHAFVARFDSAGRRRWSKRFAASVHTAAYHVPLMPAVTSSGDVVLAGAVGGRIDLGGGVMTMGPDPPDGCCSGLVVGKLTKDGDHVWSRGFASEGAVSFPAVTVTKDGHIAIGGSFSGKWDLGLGPREAKFSSPTVVVLSKDGVPELQWLAEVGGSSPYSNGGSVGSLAAGTDGAIFITGGQHGEVRLAPKDGGYVARLDGGVVSWVKSRAGWAGRAMVDPDGNPLVLTYPDATKLGTSLVSMSPAGVVRSDVAVDFGVTTVAFAKDGDFVLGGAFMGTAKFGVGDLHTDTEDAFIAKVPATDYRR